MKILKRRDFLKGTGLAFFGPALLAKGVPAQEKEIDWFKEIHRVADPHSLTPVEKKHAPVISIPSYIKAKQVFYLTAQVGETLHVMTPQHWIMWLEVYVDDVLISRTEFSPYSPYAIVTVPLSLDRESTVKVLERCNLHGIWESSVRAVPS